MSIINLQKTAEHITNWIKDYATKAGVKTLVFGLSGGIDSALVALLCLRTGLPVIGVNMPCHSSDSAYNRAQAFADDYSIPLCKVDLSSSHDLIKTQYVGFWTNNINHNVETVMDAKYKDLGFGGIYALRSCLRSPTLSFIAHATDGLIIGSGNRSKDNLIRYYQKFGDGCVDISPIADLFKSEVYELFKFLAINTSKTIPETMGPFRTIPNSAQIIYNAIPSADLLGPDSNQEDEKDLGMTYDEIEWADRENERTRLGGWLGKGIIESNLDPVRWPNWHGYTGRQRIVIAKIYAMEKTSRHKINSNLPVCRVRTVEGLVR